MYKQAGKHFENALRLLAKYPPEDVLPESDGITAGRMAEIIRAVIAWSQRNE
jgi:chemotaxis protein methyltransferase CheR